MVSTQNKQMVQFFASMTERMSRSDLDLATIRDSTRTCIWQPGNPKRLLRRGGHRRCASTLVYSHGLRRESRTPARPRWWHSHFVDAP